MGRKRERNLDYGFGNAIDRLIVANAYLLLVHTPRVHFSTYIFVYIYKYVCVHCTLRIYYYMKAKIQSDLNVGRLGYVQTQTISSNSRKKSFCGFLLCFLFDMTANGLTCLLHYYKLNSKCLSFLASFVHLSFFFVFVVPALRPARIEMKTTILKNLKKPTACKKRKKPFPQQNSVKMDYISDVFH